MDKKKFEATMHKIAAAAPAKASPQVMALIFSNMVLMYKQHEQWPQIMLTVTSILADALMEEEEEEEVGVFDEHTDEAAVRAIQEANDFIEGVIGKKHLH